jgi:hypothetical protein
LGHSGTVQDAKERTASGLLPDDKPRCSIVKHRVCRGQEALKALKALEALKALKIM